MQQAQPHEWRKYGFGGPPEPWEHGAQRDLDRLATSYYVDILESQRQIMQREPGRRGAAPRRGPARHGDPPQARDRLHAAPLGDAGRAGARRGSARLADAGRDAAARVRETPPPGAARR